MINAHQDELNGRVEFENIKISGLIEIFKKSSYLDFIKEYTDFCIMGMEDGDHWQFLHVFFHTKDESWMIRNQIDLMYGVFIRTLKSIGVLGPEPFEREGRVRFRWRLTDLARQAYQEYFYKFM